LLTSATTKRHRLRDDEQHREFSTGANGVFFPKFAVPISSDSASIIVHNRDGGRPLSINENRDGKATVTPGKQHDVHAGLRCPNGGPRAADGAVVKADPAAAGLGKDGGCVQPEQPAAPVCPTASNGE
jgi:hypothetical protein